MNVYELNHEQILQLKQDILIERIEQGVSYGALADADNLVSNWEVCDLFDGVVFSEDDFYCTAGR